MSESTTPTVYISVSSNVEPEKNLPAALELLRERCTIRKVSSVYQSPAFGYEDQPDFLDIAVELTTPVMPQMFKENVLGRIEKQLGRDRSNQETRFGPLTLDMDILLWGDAPFSYGKKPWRVPDKMILEHAAVAIPLAEIAPDYVHPEEKVTIKEIAARFDANSIKLRDDLKFE